MEESFPNVAANHELMNWPRHNTPVSRTSQTEAFRPCRTKYVPRKETSDAKPKRGSEIFHCTHAVRSCLSYPTAACSSCNKQCLERHDPLLACANPTTSLVRPIILASRSRPAWHENTCYAADRPLWWRILLHLSIRCTSQAGMAALRFAGDVMQITMRS